MASLLRQFIRPASISLARRNVNLLNTRFMSAFVQQPAPDFKATAVVDKQFKDIKLADFQGKYLVLFFYPLDL